MVLNFEIPVPKNLIASGFIVIFRGYVQNPKVAKINFVWSACLCA